MQRRTRLLGLAALAISTGALSTGFLVTSSALAANAPDPTGAVVQLIAAAPTDPDELISCTFEGASLEALPALPAVAVPEGDVVHATGHGPIGFTAVATGVPETDVMESGVVVTGVTEAGLPQAGLLVTGGAVGADGVMGIDGVVGVDGAEPMAGPVALVLDAGSVRSGTAEECAAVTAPVAAVGATSTAPTAATPSEPPSAS